MGATRLFGYCGCLKEEEAFGVFEFEFEPVFLQKEGAGNNNGAAFEEEDAAAGFEYEKGAVFLEELVGHVMAPLLALRQPLYRLDGRDGDAFDCFH